MDVNVFNFLTEYIEYRLFKMSCGSAVSMATGYELDDRGVRL
jgi:hypothetical protein